MKATGGSGSAADIGAGNGGIPSNNGSLIVTGGELELASKGTTAQPVLFKDCEVSGGGAGRHAGAYDSVGDKIAEEGDWVVEPIPPQIYTGSAITPEPAVTHENGKVDAAYIYSNNINAGTASVAVKINGISGSKTVLFTIEKADVTVTAWPAVIGSVAVNMPLYSVLLHGGQAETLQGDPVSGTFAWINPGMAVSATEDYALRFIPGNSNYNEATGGTVRVQVEPAVSYNGGTDFGGPKRAKGRIIIKAGTEDNLLITEAMMAEAVKSTLARAGMGAVEIAGERNDVLMFIFSRAALTCFVNSEAQWLHLSCGPAVFKLGKKTAEGLLQKSKGPVTCSIQLYSKDTKQVSYSLALADQTNGKRINLISIKGNLPLPLRYAR